MSDKLDAEIRTMARTARCAFGLTPAGLDDVNLLCRRIQDAVAALRAELAALRSRLASQGAREVAERLLPALEIVEAMRPDVRTSAYDALRLNRLLLELREILLPSDGERE